MRWSFFLYIAVLLAVALSVIANEGEIVGDSFVDENTQEIRYDLESEIIPPAIEQEINNFGEAASVRSIDNVP
jgi:hypothetical protein